MTKLNLFLKKLVSIYFNLKYIFYLFIYVKAISRAMPTKENDENVLSNFMDFLHVAITPNG